MKTSTIKFPVLLLIMAILLSGCMYPHERRLENQAPSSFYLDETQKAVEQFQKDQGVLPIATKPADTPIFERYTLDFSRLVPRYIPDAPANSFEKGGVYQYTLIDVETKPTVKLIHLGVVSKVADIQQLVDRYRNQTGKLPFKDPVDQGYFTINYDLLRTQEPEIRSMVTNQLLSLLISKTGEVGVNYAPDLAGFIRNSKSKVQSNQDPRYLMAQESMFVPVKSFPYTMIKGEPHLLEIP
ncbi:hypothetical protein ACQCN2_04230 [Brevibacillus ginsengisoli]|uniref:hypothetical protein n=1 Tax=Brevibacillus ginsengisoli TaxID=363854 RepID=UPI003CE8FF5D